MAITREKKGEALAKLKGVFGDGNSIVFVNFHKLTVADSSALRRALREAGVSYAVAKKSLLKLVLKDQTVEGQVPALDGELALAYGSDPIAPARGIRAFAQTHPDTLSILGGVFEGRFMDKAAMTEVSMIPSRQTLYAQFVNLINSPIAQFAIVVDQIASRSQTPAEVSN
jgi:large subunit ribosomal protein L10